MFRLLTLIFTTVFFTTIQPALSSEQFLELSAPKKANLQVIGTVPPKRHIDLDLGELRTENARLPDGERDLEARKRLRVRRALARQKAVTNAKRDKARESAISGNASQDAVPNEKGEDAKSDAGEKSGSGKEELAQAKKPKIIKSYKNNQKAGSGGSKKQLPPNANLAGPISIE